MRSEDGVSEKGSGYKIEMSQSGNAHVVEASSGRLSILVPISLKRRSARQLITLPDGTQHEPRPWDTELTPQQLALARDRRWLAMLETGEAKSLREIAEKEGVDNSYVSRMVNLTTLAPDTVEAILYDQMPPTVTLFDLVVDPTRLWLDQVSKYLQIVKPED